MIGYLKGKVLDVSEGGKAVVAVGDVGYLVNVGGSAPLAAGQAVELHVHTHVREDALDLYGFATRDEKELFLTLLSVNGIGPKGAMNILSSIDAGSLVEAILEGDKDSLTQVPGIGKKTAERLVLELADPLRKKQGTVKAPAAGATSRASGDPVLRDAKEALLGLGYREQDVSACLNRMLRDGAAPGRAEDLVRTALRELA
jgi:Holliday junction DNA helicase RuvA